MKRRRLGWLGTLLTTLVGLTLGVDATLATTDPTSTAVKQELERIMAAPPFRSEHTAYQWRYRGEHEPESETPSVLPDFLLGLSALLGSFAQVLLWIVVIGLIVLVFVYRQRWLGLFAREAANPQVRLPSALFGHDEVVEPLPADVPGAAWKLWCDGHKRACLSMLYRGALLNLIVRRRLELPDSATEEDCLRLITGLDAQALSDYFVLLTRSWQRVAYAALMPDERQAKHLCDDWREHFAGD